MVSPSSCDSKRIERSYGEPREEEEEVSFTGLANNSEAGEGTIHDDEPEDPIEVWAAIVRSRREAERVSGGLITTSSSW